MMHSSFITTYLSPHNELLDATVAGKETAKQ